MAKAIFLDLDGTVYLGNRVIPGVSKAVEELEKSGKKIFFISNSSTKNREEIVKKLANMGIKCSVSNVYNAAYAVAHYIKNKYPKAKVFCISDGGLNKELEAVGIAVIDNNNADIVVTGLDQKLTYNKLVIALQAILNGAIFITSNQDRVYPTENGLFPGSGTIAAFLEYGSKVRPLNLGKPNTYIFEAVLEENNLKKDDVLVVGDSYETDFVAAKKLGLKCALVLSGITKKDDLKKLREKPDIVADDLPNLLSSL